MKLKTITLLLLTIMMGVGNAWGYKTPAKWGTPASNGRWDASTGLYTWTAGSNNLATIFQTPNGILADYKSLHLTTSGYTSAYRVCFMNGSTAVATIMFYSEGPKDLVFSERIETKNLDLSTISHISFGGQSSSGSITVQNVYMELKDDNKTSCNLNQYNFLEWNDVTTNPTVKGYQSQAEYNVGISAVTAWGSSAVWDGSFADLSNVSRIEAIVKSGTPRFMFNRIEKLTPKHAILTVTPSDNAGKAYLKTYTVEEGTLWVIDVAKIKADQGHAHLQAVKGLNNGNMTVSSIKLRGEESVISSFVDEAKNYAMGYSNATIFDACDLSGATLSPANPNCIIIANKDCVKNTANVSINGTIANLSLTDGKPFAVPAGATATKATYTRSASNNYGTICLPYAVESDAKIQYYTLGENDGNSIKLVEAQTVEAGEPAIFKKLSDDGNITATGSGALSDATVGSASTGTVLTMKGTYTQKKFTTDLDKYYYVSSNKVMQATNSLTVNPFRAYMETAASAAKSFALTLDDVTALNAVFNAEESEVKVVAIYGIGGNVQSDLQKGINIVKLSNGTSKKIVIE